MSFNKDLFNSVKIKSMKSKLGMFLTAKNPNKDWVTKYAVHIDQAPPSSREF